MKHQNGPTQSWKVLSILKQQNGHRGGKQEYFQQLTWQNVTFRLVALTVLALDTTDATELLLLRELAAASSPSWIGSRFENCMAKKVEESRLHL
jgi:hypothetical protein